MKLTNMQYYLNTQAWKPGWHASRNAYTCWVPYERIATAPLIPLRVSCDINTLTRRPTSTRTNHSRYHMYQRYNQSWQVPHIIARSTAE